jgi:rubrerythrin
LLQSYTDILPGRPTALQHRAPEDELRNCYDKRSADLLTKLHAMTLVAGEHQTHDYYMNIGPGFADPLARQLYAEIASIEEKHVTQYESMADATETWLEKWLLHEATEVYNYYSCATSEPNPRVRAVWERFLEYELGHVRFVADLLEQTERRDASEILQGALPAPIDYVSHREFVRDVLRNEVGLTSVGPNFVPMSEVPRDNLSGSYRDHLNSQGSPTQDVAAGYVWTPGTELAEKEPVTARATGNGRKRRERATNVQAVDRRLS